MEWVAIIGWLIAGLGLLTLIDAFQSRSLQTRRSGQVSEATFAPAAPTLTSQAVQDAVTPTPARSFVTVTPSLVPTSPSTPTPVPGRQAPDFTLPTLDEQTISLSDLRGQRVLINFWATWCGPCRIEMPVIERIYERYRDQGFVVLAVNVEEPEDRVRPFVAELGLTFPILLDENGDVVRQYGIVGLPTSVFVNRDGLIFQQHLGVLTETLLVDSLLAIP